jgi:hypothetical protein
MVQILEVAMNDDGLLGLFLTRGNRTALPAGNNQKGVNAIQTLIENALNVNASRLSVSSGKIKTRTRGKISEVASWALKEARRNS